jgi:hypothetical protein
MAAAAPARTRSRRTAPAPRRISGPVRGGRAAGAVAVPPPLALRLGGRLHGIAEHRLLERIIRGRAWIAILAVGLIGIVFMQVSMLRLNAGIGRDIEQATRLERENSTLRATLSELTSGDRIEAEAAKLGFVLPPAGAARFLSARGFDPARALREIQVPSHLAPLPVGTDSTVSSTTPAVGSLPATGVAPGATAAAGTTAAATTPPATGTTTATGTATATSTTTGTATTAGTTQPSTTQSTTPTPTQTAQPASATPPPSGGTTSTATATPTATGGVSPTGG